MDLIPEKWSILNVAFVAKLGRRLSAGSIPRKSGCGFDSLRRRFDSVPRHSFFPLKMTVFLQPPLREALALKGEKQVLNRWELRQ
jgi:hypothetical protein